MSRYRSRLLRVVAAAALLGAAGGTVQLAHAATPTVDPGPTPKAQCGPGSKPEAEQGRVPAADYKNGRAAEGYTCNLALVGRDGSNAGFRVYRYIDTAGHECAFYDSGPLFPFQVFLSSPGHTAGVFVLDMSDPAHPKQTATLTTPAMISPHESLNLNVTRGLLAADMGNALTLPGWVDIYDVKSDCLHPKLLSSTPLGILGHEGTFSPDGNTFWVSSGGFSTITAIDVSDPAVPKFLTLLTAYRSHGLNVSDDGNRLYVAILPGSGTPGLVILDVSDIQKRVANPTVKLISQTTWPDVSIPQVPIPVTIGGHPYLVEVDEYATAGGSPIPSAAADASVGGARIIDIADEKKPKVTSTIKLEANLVKNRGTEASDNGMKSSLQGYAGHYCNVPQRTDPGIMACSFIASGLRVFDIRDPQHPRELAYYNAPPSMGTTSQSPSNYAMSAPTFVPGRSEIWYSDGNSGFYDVHLANGVWPFSTGSATPAVAPPKVLGSTVTAPTPRPAPAGTRDLPATGGLPWAPAGVAALALAGGCRMVRRASRRPSKV